MSPVPEQMQRSIRYARALLSQPMPVQERPAGYVEAGYVEAQSSEDKGAPCDCDKDWNGGHWPSCPTFDHTGHLCAICQPEAVAQLFKEAKE